jgi:hypothetical protein
MENDNGDLNTRVAAREANGVSDPDRLASVQISIQTFTSFTTGRAPRSQFLKRRPDAPAARASDPE